MHPRIATVLFATRSRKEVAGSTPGIHLPEGARLGCTWKHGLARVSEWLDKEVVS